MKDVIKGKLSVVTTLYKSSAYIDEFVEKTEAVLLDTSCTDVEIIVVNDGSPDDSLEKIIRIKQLKSYPIKIIDFSRNFGHHNAIHAGLTMAEGDFIFLIDSDLETEPSILKEFINKMNLTDCDVVYGYQEIRKGSVFERLSGKLFWKMFNFLSNSNLQENILTERLMTRKYLDNLLVLNDKNLFMAGMMYWIGFKQIGIPVVKKLRQGKSTYTLFKRLNLMFNAVASYSSKPLVSLFYFGLLVSILSFFFGMYFAIRKLLHPELILLGWSSIILTVIFCFGLLITSVGIIGIYLAKIFNQTLNRPLYIIKNIIK
jgi:putative glycosyltransferase